MGKMRLPFIDNGLLYRGADLTVNNTTVVEIFNYKTIIGYLKDLYFLFKDFRQNYYFWMIQM